MEVSMTSLPSELMAAILSHLSLSSLMAFSTTSRVNQVLGYKAMRKLSLSVFQKDMHCQLAHMSPLNTSIALGSCTDDDDEQQSRFSISRTTNLPTRGPSKCSNPGVLLQQQISAQNKIAADILSKQSMHNLRSLSLQMYDIRSSDLMSILATNLPRLKELNISLCHTYVHDHSLPPNYWREAPDGSPCWNALAGLGAENLKNLRLHSLQVLRIERAGSTSVQLQKLVESNPQLQVLHLKNVAGVDLRFLNWLGARCENGPSNLEELSLESCALLRLQKLEDFAWLAGIAGSSVRHLSLWRCRNVRPDMLSFLVGSEECDFKLDVLQTLIPPTGPVMCNGVLHKMNPHSRPAVLVLPEGKSPTRLLETMKIDVDPEYMVSPIAVAA